MQPVKAEKKVKKDTKAEKKAAQKALDILQKEFEKDKKSVIAILKTKSTIERRPDLGNDPSKGSALGRRKLLPFLDSDLFRPHFEGKWIPKDCKLNFSCSEFEIDLSQFTIVNGFNFANALIESIEKPNKNFSKVTKKAAMNFVIGEKRTGCMLHIDVDGTDWKSHIKIIGQSRLTKSLSVSQNDDIMCYASTFVIPINDNIVMIIKGNRVSVGYCDLVQKNSDCNAMIYLHEDFLLDIGIDFGIKSRHINILQANLTSNKLEANNGHLVLYYREDANNDDDDCKKCMPMIGNINIGNHDNDPPYEPAAKKRRLQ